MANRRVSVWKYVKVGTNWRYCKPVLGANNKIKPHWVYVKGVAEQHPEGNYPGGWYWSCSPLARAGKTGPIWNGGKPS